MSATSVSTITGSPPRRSAASTPLLQHLETCHEALGSDRAVANILGVSPSQVSRWRRGQTPDIDNADKLAGLALVVEMLGRWLEPESLPGWLTGAHAHLEDRSPAYLIGRGSIADVVGAIEAEKAGVFA
jgi:transcriptional regulator with XRE-family HTH domain